MLDDLEPNPSQSPPNKKLSTLDISLTYAYNAASTGCSESPGFHAPGGDAIGVTCELFDNQLTCPGRTRFLSRRNQNRTNKDPVATRLGRGWDAVWTRFGRGF